MSKNFHVWLSACECAGMWLWMWVGWSLEGVALCLLGPRVSLLYLVPLGLQCLSMVSLFIWTWNHSNIPWVSRHTVGIQPIPVAAQAKDWTIMQFCVRWIWIWALVLLFTKLEPWDLIFHPQSKNNHTPCSIFLKRLLVEDYKRHVKVLYKLESTVQV